MLRHMLLIFLLVVSLPVYSEKIVITGKPVTLELHPGYFTFPQTYTDRNMGYYFVTIAGINRVCYLKKQPELSRLDTIQIIIEKNKLQLPWTCYQYNSVYFESDY